MDLFSHIPFIQAIPNFSNFFIGVQALGEHITGMFWYESYDTYNFEGLHNQFWPNSTSFITLSSNARRVPFEYSQIYLNKKGKACKARVNEWIINQI